MAKVAMVSQISGKEHTREIDAGPFELHTWINADRVSRDPIHVAFPNLSAEDREFIMTGITPEEWEEVFGPDPSEESETCEDWEHDVHAEVMAEMRGES